MHLMHVAALFLDGPAPLCYPVQNSDEVSTVDKRMENVKRYYDENALEEWERLERHPFEFLLTTYMMEKHIHSGDRVLDIGGGPGRYAIHFAKLGCDVTLVDLSQGNIALAREKAEAAGVSIHAHAANCLDLDELGLGQFDHVFLMGPLYHLQDEEDRIRAVKLALSRLKPQGFLYVSFILAFAGILYDLKNAGYIAEDCASPAGRRLIDCVVEGRNYVGPGFTNVCFYHQDAILPFMARFGLEKQHLFGQEGILAPNERELLSRDETERAQWLSVAKRLLESETLLSYSEHAMYIGKKSVESGREIVAYPFIQ